MAKKKTYKTKKKSTEVNEQVVAYGTKRIAFFNSFEEENEYVAKQRVDVPYDKRMMDIELLRKNVFHKFLLPDGTWPPIAPTFKIMPPYSNDVSK